MIIEIRYKNGDLKIVDAPEIVVASSDLLSKLMPRNIWALMNNKLPFHSKTKLYSHGQQY